MPWWLTLALDWFPAVLVALAAGWWLDLPIGAMALVFLIVVGITKAGQRIVRAVRGQAPASGSAKAGGKAE